jgi:hypothetical protein
MPLAKLGILADSTWLTELYRRGLVARTREDIPSGFQYLYRRADSAVIHPGIAPVSGPMRAVSDLPALGENL